MVVLNSNCCLCGKNKNSDLSIKSERQPCWLEYYWLYILAFTTLTILCHLLLAWRVSLEKSADHLMGVSLHFICHFSLLAFNVLSLSLVFVSLIPMCLFPLFFLGSILPGTHCASCTCLNIFFSMLGKFSAVISSNIIPGPFSVLLLGPL